MAATDGYLRAVPSDADRDDGRLYSPTAPTLDCTLQLGAEGGCSISGAIAQVAAITVGAEGGVAITASIVQSGAIAVGSQGGVLILGVEVDDASIASGAEGGSAVAGTLGPAPFGSEYISGSRQDLPDVYKRQALNAWLAGSLQPGPQLAALTAAPPITTPRLSPAPERAPTPAPVVAPAPPPLVAFLWNDLPSCDAEIRATLASGATLAMSSAHCADQTAAVIFGDGTEVDELFEVLALAGTLD